jgi:hypothetical protein
MSINDYDDIYKKFRECLLTHKPDETIQITRAIKRFFSCYFMGYEILSSDNIGEYILDVLVVDYRPKELINSDKKSMTLTQVNYMPLLAVESELGGTGASSAYGVMKNVAEDFLKLLLISSKYKIMIFTSLKFKNEIDYINNRVNLLHEMYKNSPSNNQEILLIHIEGSQPESTQVKVSISENTISDYIIDSDSIKLL